MIYIPYITLPTGFEVVLHNHVNISAVKCMCIYSSRLNKNFEQLHISSDQVFLSKQFMPNFFTKVKKNTFGIQSFGISELWIRNCEPVFPIWPQAFFQLPLSGQAFHLTCPMALIFSGFPFTVVIIIKAAAAITSTVLTMCQDLF